MKKAKLFLYAFLFSVTSCDVLDKEPLDMISDNVVWADQALMDDYLNQCYAEMKFYFEMPYDADMNSLMVNNSTNSITIADEGDEAWGGTRFKTNNINISGGLFEWWGYSTVRKLNIFIDKMNSSDVSETYRQQRLAEACFLRAFAYFNMVKRYGGVPLITTVPELTSPEKDLYPAREKEEVVYDFILSELNDIIDNEKLPKEYDSANEGRPTYYAALALKSRVAMYAGSIATWGTVQNNGIVGIPRSKAITYWQASFDASEKIIKSNKFHLYEKYPTDKVKNFRNLFLDEDNNPEVIFSERFNGLAGKGHSWDMLNVPVGYHTWGGGQKINIYLDMVESFDNIDGTSGIIDRDKVAAGHLWTMEELWGKKDPRFKASVFGHGSIWTHKEGTFALDYHSAILVDGQKRTSGSYKGVLCKRNSAGRQKTHFGVLKYLDEEERSVTHERRYSDTDYIIFRLGEIYLNYAEAAIELGRNEDALEAVNIIRKRAGMPKYSSITRETVRKERKVELAFEGNRYFDLVRWRRAVNDLTKDYHNLVFILDGDSFEEGKYDVLTAKYKLEITNNAAGSPHPYFEEKHYYLPISNLRTAANPNLVENPGYY